MKLNLSANTLTENKLLACNRELGTHFISDVLFIKSPIIMGLDDALRREIEELPTTRKKRLTVMLETT